MKLRQIDCSRLLKILTCIPVPAEEWVFGNRVTGEVHEGSDQDLVSRRPSGIAMEPGAEDGKDY